MENIIKECSNVTLSNNFTNNDNNKRTNINNTEIKNINNIQNLVKNNQETSNENISINNIENNSEKKLIRKKDIKLKKAQEREQLEKFIIERTKNFVKEVNQEYSNRNNKYYGSINENNNQINFRKNKNIDLYDDLDDIKKEKILKFWEKRKIYKFINDIIQEIIDYTVHRHYYNKNYDEINFNNTNILYNQWNIKNELDELEKKINSLQNNFKTNIWVKKIKDKDINSTNSSLYNSQDLNKNTDGELTSNKIKDKTKNKNSSNLNLLKQMFSNSKQDNSFELFINSSSIDSDKIEKDYENKVNNVNITISNKLKEINETKDFISSSWNFLKDINIKNTMKIVNYYGPIYHNLSWPTEYIIPEIDEYELKNKNLIYWTNDQLYNMIYSDISKIEKNLISSNEVLNCYKDIYELEKNVNNRYEKKVNIKKSTIKQHLISKKYLNKNQSFSRNNKKRNNNKNSLSCTLNTSNLLSKNGIIAIPNKICFEKFTPYKPFSAILIIKNTTYETHRIQVVIESEENSKYFRIYKIFSPGDNGLISPGLSAHYKIVFNPVSLKTCSATVTITSSYGDKVIVNILAKIKEPIIDIPEVLNCNPCRVNSSSITEVTVRNTGGKGKFLIIDNNDMRTCEELHDIKSNNSYDNYIYKNGSFNIIPGYNEINENDKIKLKILFKPKYVLNFKKENKTLNYIEEIKVCLAWDNCEKQVITIRGSAQEPCITIENNDESIEKKTYKDINSNQEIIYSNMLNFDTCNVNSEIVKTLRLKNITDVTIPVKWNIIDTPIDSMNKYSFYSCEKSENKNYKLLYNKTNEVQKSNKNLLLHGSYSSFDNNINVINKNNNCCNDDNNNKSKIEISKYNIGKRVLKIFPQETVFKPKEIIEFKFVFKPKNYKHYDIIAQLLYNKHLNLIEDEINDNEIVFIRCKGKSEPVNIEIIPSIINIAEKLDIDNKYEKEIIIKNIGKSNVSYVSNLNNNSPEIVSIQLNKSNGIIKPGSCETIYLSIKGHFPGKFNGNISLFFNNHKSNNRNININGEMYYKSGTFLFDKKIIDFGIIQLGSCAKEYLFLTNNSDNKINWRINLYAKNKEKCDYLALFEPKKGYLESKRTVKIDILFIPLWYQLFRGEIVCELVNERCEYTEDIIQNNEFVISPQKYQSHSIRLIANVLTPKAILQNNNTKENCICYLNIEKELFITLKNITLLPTHYKIKPVNNENVDIKFEKEEGILDGNEEINIKLYVKGKTIGKFDNIIINAVIDGMVENCGNLSVELNLEIKGLDVDIEIYNTLEDFNNKQIDYSNCLNYGSNCKLFKPYTKIIRIINTFQVESNFEITMKKYNINYDAITDDINNMASKKLILKPKNNKKIFFYSENGQQYIKEKLFKKDNIENINKIIFDKYGAGFKITPRTGILKPYDIMDIEVTAYSNISGVYDDILTVKVSNSIEKNIPINMEVKGVPLTYINLLSTKENNKDIKDLFFSTRLISSNVNFNENSCLDIPDGNNTVTKTICIFNESPKDVILSWKLLINKTKLNKYKEFKSIVGKNSELINMSLELLEKISIVSPEVLEVKQILESDLESNNNKTEINGNIPIASVNSLWDCNQTSFISENNYTNDIIDNEVQDTSIKELNYNNDENNKDESISLSRDVSIITLDFDENNSYKSKKSNKQENDVEKQTSIDMENKFALSYKSNVYDIFTVEPETATIKSNDKITFKITMKSSYEGIYDALLYSGLTYISDSETNNTNEQYRRDDIRDIINNESITKLHLFGIITVPRLKFENNLDYYLINLKYNNIKKLKTFSIINPSENVNLINLLIF